MLYWLCIIAQAIICLKIWKKQIIKKLATAIFLFLILLFVENKFIKDRNIHEIAIATVSLFVLFLILSIPYYKTKRQIKKIVKRVFKVANVTSSYKVKNSIVGGTASYSWIKDRFEFSPSGMKKNFKSANGRYGSFKEFVEIVVWHEVGHKKDETLVTRDKECDRIEDEVQKMAKEKTVEELYHMYKSKNEIVVEMEKTAWNYAEKNLPNYINKKYFENKKEDSLSSYIEQEDELYKKAQKTKELFG